MGKHYTRQEWGAQVPVSSAKVRTPVNRVYIHHSVTKASGSIVTDARLIERIGRSRFGIFSYSYVVEPGGDSATGAGLHRGAHTGGHNSTSLAICFVGNYETAGPTEAAINQAADIILMLKRAGVVSPNASILPHSSVKSTACPGRHLRNAIPILRAVLAQKDSVVAAPAVPAPSKPAAVPAGPSLADINTAIAAVAKHTYRRGDRSDGVKWIQALLNNKGARLATDGIFGRGTERVVRFFQGASGLKVDGVVGPQTWQELRK